jgi:uroporphyrinogen decarboxylase
MSRTMTPRQRVRTCFACGEPDRVPVDYSSNPGIDRRLKEHFGLAANDSEGLLRKLGVDFRSVSAPYVGPKLHADIPDRHIDLWGIRTRWVEHDSGGYWDYCDFPLKDATVEQAAAWPMPDPDAFDYAAVARRCRELADFALVAGGAGTGDIINKSGMIGGHEWAFLALAGDDPAIDLLLNRRLGVQLEVTRRTLAAGEGLFDVLHIGEDLGTQRGPLISLDLFRRQIRPRQQPFVDLGREFGIPVMIHSCGSSSWAFEDFIEMGISVVDTLQPEAKDMAPADLKRRFGGRLAFHGMISTAGPVAKGTVADTVAAVRQTLAIMKPGGGYALAPTHQLQDNSPTENVVAMYRAARELGAYDA